MNILHVIQSLDPSWGGIARMLPQLAAGLAAKGETCRIATLAGGRFGAPPDVPGVEVLPFAAVEGSRLGRSSEFKRSIPALVREADVVHLHGLWTAQNWAAGKLARRLDRPYIMTPHSMMMPWAWRRSAWKKRPIGWLFEHRNLRHAARLHALAEGEAEHMRALGFNPRIEVLPNGVNADEFADLPPPDGLIERFPALRDARWIVFLGRIHPQKGLIPGLQACFDAAAAAGDWRVVIAGPDEIGMQRMIQAAAARKGLARHLVFTGMLPRPDVLALLSRASILLQPSLSEGLSMSILEALASGVPVLISTACNMPEVQHVGAGRVVEPRRPAIAAALRELLTMPDAARRAMGDAGRALIRERFDWMHLLPRYGALYAAVSSGA